VIAGSSDGQVTAWSRAPVGPDGAPVLVRTAQFASQSAGITAMTASTRDRTFATASADGAVVLRHQTSQRTLVEVPGRISPVFVTMTPRSDGLFVVRENGTVDRFAVANSHPEISWHTLFGKVWYIR
jgi:phosphate transport system permease protein